MRQLVDRYVAALDEVDRHVGAIGPDSWHNSTPCTEWDLRQLLDHLVYETLWVPDLVAGATLEEVGGRYEGDRLGNDPKGAWTKARAAAVERVRSSPLDVPVHTSGGETTADAYLTEMLFDAVIHGWDVAQSIGVEHEIDDDVARDLEAWFAPSAERMVAAGVIARPIEVSPKADAATRLIALSGRTP
jgi:uncharacterized protein (TIGR03086 family)